jgi:hypothetical protein
MFEIEDFLIVVALARALVTFTSSPAIGDGRGSRHSQFGQRNGGINVGAGMSGSGSGPRQLMQR